MEEEFSRNFLLKENFSKIFYEKLSTEREIFQKTFPEKFLLTEKSFRLKEKYLLKENIEYFPKRKEIILTIIFSLFQVPHQLMILAVVTLTFHSLTPHPRPNISHVCPRLVPFVVNNTTTIITYYVIWNLNILINYHKPINV